MHKSAYLAIVKNGSTVLSSFWFIAGLVALLEVASQVAEHKGLPTTENTRMHSSLLFQKIYDDLHSDKERDKFKNTAQAWFT